MRQIYSEGMVAHLWANRAVDFARTHDNDFAARGDTLRSRTTAIARWTTFGGREIVLLNRSEIAGKYEVRNALKEDVPVVEVVNPDDAVLDAHLLKFRDAVDGALLSASKVRAGHNRDALLRDARRDADLHNEAVRFFGSVAPLLEIPPEFEQAVAQAQGREAEREKAREELRRVDHERQLELDRQVLVDWLEGRTDSTPRTAVRTLLRIKGNLVQTSRGAEIPVRHAKILWPHLLRNRRDHTSVSGELRVRLGQFKLDSIEADGSIHVGCHHIEFDEMERIAVLLGLPMDADTALAQSHKEDFDA
jgi:hypothetical protein